MSFTLPSGGGILLHSIETSGFPNVIPELNVRLQNTQVRYCLGLIPHIGDFPHNNTATDTLSIFPREC